MDVPHVRAQAKRHELVNVFPQFFSQLHFLRNSGVCLHRAKRGLVERARKRARPGQRGRERARGGRAGESFVSEGRGGGPQTRERKAGKGKGDGAGGGAALCTSMLSVYAKTVTHQCSLRTCTHTRTAPPHEHPLRVRTHLQTAFANGKRFMCLEICRIQLCSLRRVHQRTADEFLFLGLACFRQARVITIASMRPRSYTVSSRHVPAGAGARLYGARKIQGQRCHA